MPLVLVFYIIPEMHVKLMELIFNVCSILFYGAGSRQMHLESLAVHALVYNVLFLIVSYQGRHIHVHAHVPVHVQHVCQQKHFSELVSDNFFMLTIFQLNFISTIIKVHRTNY